MAERARTRQSAGSEWDHVALRLQEWRRRAGEPSFTEIAGRISRARVADGSEPAAARVGRTTVYDAFRLGRTRINLALVREIGLALDADPDEVEAVLDGPVVDEQPVAAQAGPDVAAGRFDAWRPALALMAACVGANLLGRELVDLLNLPVYLDMVGTALAAIVLGAWRGAAVGATTNVVGLAISGVASAPFAIVNVVGALVWGLGVHRFGMGRTLARFFALTLVVAVACTVVSVPILYWMFGGSTGHGQDTLTGNLLDLTHSLPVSLALSNLMTSTADKLISAFAALVAASALGVGIAGVVAQPRPDGAGPA